MEGARNWGKIKFQNLEPATDVAYKGDDERGAPTLNFCKIHREENSSAMATMVDFKFTITWEEETLQTNKARSEINSQSLEDV